MWPSANAIRNAIVGCNVGKIKGQGKHNRALYNTSKSENCIIGWQLWYDTNENTHHTENCNKNKSVMVTWQLLENLSLNVFVSAVAIPLCMFHKKKSWIVSSFQLLRAFSMWLFHMFILLRLVDLRHSYLCHVYFWDELAFVRRLHLMWKFIQMVYLSRYNLIWFDFIKMTHFQ